MATNNESELKWLVPDDFESYSESEQEILAQKVILDKLRENPYEPVNCEVFIDSSPYYSYMGVFRLEKALINLVTENILRAISTNSGKHYKDIELIDKDY